jgi:hypothetical protein
VPPSVHLGRIDHGQPGLTPASAHSFGSLEAKGTRQRSEESKSHILPSPNRNSIAPANSSGLLPRPEKSRGRKRQFDGSGKLLRQCAHHEVGGIEFLDQTGEIPRKIILGLWVLRLGSQAGCTSRLELYSGP